MAAPRGSIFDRHREKEAAGLDPFSSDEDGDQYPHLSDKESDDEIGDDDEIEEERQVSQICSKSIITYLTMLNML
jgi:hypothetical protein